MSYCADVHGRSFGRISFSILFFLAGSTWAALALAFERQWHVGVGAGYASLNRGPGASGWGAGAHAAYGLNDAFNALFALDWTRHGDVRTSVLSAAAGAAYTLDVVRLVPYAGALLGGYRLIGDLEGNGLGLQLAGGLDYQLTRDWAIGAQFRWHAVPFVDVGDGFSYMTLFLRAEYLWGF